MPWHDRISPQEVIAPVSQPLHHISFPSLGRHLQHTEIEPHWTAWIVLCGLKRRSCEQFMIEMLSRHSEIVAGTQEAIPPRQV